MFENSTQIFQNLTEIIMVYIYTYIYTDIYIHACVHIIISIPLKIVYRSQNQHKETNKTHTKSPLINKQ